MLLTNNDLGEFISLCKFDKERITRYSMETFKREFAEYLAHTFILSNAPKEEGDKLWIELNKLVLPNIPQKLFRFRGCEVCHKVKECDEYSKSFTSIYPVIYFETRYNATDSIINLITNQILQSIISTKDLLPVDPLHWYKANLYKGRNGYAQEKEWRMLSHCPSATDSDFTEIADRQCIKAIY